MYMYLRCLYASFIHSSFSFHQVSVLRQLDHPNVLQFMGVLYREKKLILVTGSVFHKYIFQYIVDITLKRLVPHPCRCYYNSESCSKVQIKT